MRKIWGGSDWVGGLVEWSLEDTWIVEERVMCEDARGWWGCCGGEVRHMWHSHSATDG